MVAAVLWLDDDMSLTIDIKIFRTPTADIV